MKRFLLASVLALAVLAGAPVAAHDRVVHYDVVLAIALANGFSKEEAALIAAASQGLDDNESTTAFEFGLIAKEAAQVMTGSDPTELSHMREGQAFHALTANRTTVDQAHVDRLNRSLEDFDISRKRSLYYLGQYLHFLADSVVHPENTLIGHAAEGHEPDRADLDYKKLRVSVALMSEQLSAFKSDLDSGTRKFRATTPEDYTFSMRPPAAQDKRGSLMLEAVMTQVRESWVRTYAYSNRFTVDGWVEQLGQAADIYTGDKDRARFARATSEIARVLGERGYEYSFYKGYEDPNPTMKVDEFGQVVIDSPAPVPRDRIEMDAEGEPVSGGKWGDFGDKPADGGFVSEIAKLEEMKAERERVTATQALRAAGSAAVEAQFGWRQWRRQDDDEQRMAAAWQPPSSPGGIALDPRLDLPMAELGTPKAIALRGRAVVLVTERGEYPFVGVSPRSLATLARAIAVGQSPYLTIGSEPSGRPGYARVTLPPSLEGTSVGRTLYEADLQFKTIFAGLPLTQRQRSLGLDRLIEGYPGNGGDFVRLWITSSDIELALHSGHLVPKSAGMQVNSETRIGSYARRDPEMEAYAARLTADWNELANALPEFRQVQALALATAVVFWTREHGVPIDPMILLLPSEYVPTPSHTPVVARHDGRIAIAGGVSLAPEDRGSELGRIFVTGVRARLSMARVDGGDVLPRGLLASQGLAMMLLACLLPATVAWLLLGRRLPLGWRGACAAWTQAVLANFGILALLTPALLGDALSLFDRDFLALMATIVAFPVILWAILRRRLGAIAAIDAWRRRGLVLLALCGPLAVGVLGLGMACTTMALTGPIPSRSLNRVITVQLAPWITAASAFSTARADSWSPLPESLLAAQGPRFESYAGGLPEGEVIILDGNDPNLPARELRRVRWPEEQQPAQDAAVHYTVDGKPPL